MEFDTDRSFIYSGQRSKWEDDLSAEDLDLAVFLNCPGRPGQGRVEALGHDRDLSHQDQTLECLGPAERATASADICKRRQGKGRNSKKAPAHGSNKETMPVTNALRQAKPAALPRPLAIASQVAQARNAQHQPTPDRVASKSQAAVQPKKIPGSCVHRQPLLAVAQGVPRLVPSHQQATAGCATPDQLAIVATTVNNTTPKPRMPGEGHVHTGGAAAWVAQAGQQVASSTSSLREAELVSAVLQLEDMAGRMQVRQARASEDLAKARLASALAGAKDRAALNKEATSARKAAQEGEAERALLQRRLQSLQSFLRREKEQREEAEKRAAAAEQRAAALGAQVEAGRQQLMSLQAAVPQAGAWQEEQLAADARAQRLHTRLARSQSALAASQAEAQALRLQQAALEEQVAGLQRALEELYVSKISGGPVGVLAEQVSELKHLLLAVQEEQAVHATTQQAAEACKRQAEAVEAADHRGGHDQGDSSPSRSSSSQVTPLALTALDTALAALGLRQSKGTGSRAAAAPQLVHSQKAGEARAPGVLAAAGAATFDDSVSHPHQATVQQRHLPAPRAPAQEKAWGSSGSGSEDEASVQAEQHTPGRLQSRIRLSTHRNKRLQLRRKRVGAWAATARDAAAVKAALGALSSPAPGPSVSLHLEAYQPQLLVPNKDSQAGAPQQEGAMGGMGSDVSSSAGSSTGQGAGSGSSDEAGSGAEPSPRHLRHTHRGAPGARLKQAATRAHEIHGPKEGLSQQQQGTLLRAVQQQLQLQKVQLQSQRQQQASQPHTGSLSALPAHRGPQAGGVPMRPWLRPTLLLNEKPAAADSRGMCPADLGRTQPMITRQWGSQVAATQGATPSHTSSPSPSPSRSPLPSPESQPDLRLPNHQGVAVSASSRLYVGGTSSPRATHSWKSAINPTTEQATAAPQFLLPLRSGTAQNGSVSPEEGTRAGLSGRVAASLQRLHAAADAALQEAPVPQVRSRRPSPSRRTPAPSTPRAADMRPTTTQAQQHQPGVLSLLQQARPLQGDMSARGQGGGGDSSQEESGRGDAVKHLFEGNRSAVSEVTLPSTQQQLVTTSVPLVQLHHRPAGWASLADTGAESSTSEGSKQEVLPSQLLPQRTRAQSALRALGILGGDSDGGGCGI